MLILLPKIIEPSAIPVFEKSPEKQVLLYNPIEKVTVVEPGFDKYMIPYFAVDEKELATWFGLQELLLMVSTKLHHGIYITVYDFNESVKFGGAILQVSQ